LHVGTTDQSARALIDQNAEHIKRLARVERISIADQLPALESAPRDVVAGMEIAVPLEGLIDVAKEKERVTKEIARKETEAAGLGSRLDNASFVERAPREVVVQTRNRHLELLGEIEKLRTTLNTLGA